MRRVRYDDGSMVEKILFFVVAAGSLFAFWGRFGTVYQTILRSKHDADFQLAPVGKRIWDFFWEVLCQAKVIKERPLPGLAHAFVFGVSAPSAWSR